MGLLLTWGKLILYNLDIEKNTQERNDLIGNKNVVISQQNYKAGSVNGIWAEQNHALDNAREKNYRDDLTYKNTTLEHEKDVDKYKNCREYLDHFIKENDIKGRIRLDDGKRATNVLTSCVITLSTEAYQQMTAQQREQYFRDGLDYLKECYPNYKILDATIHRDEGYYDENNKWQKGLDHLQVLSIPVYYNQEKNQMEISTTKAEKAHLIREMEREGRDTSHIDLREQRQYLHDRFVDFNRDRGRDFDYKSREGHQSRLDVKMYKKVKDREREIDRDRDALDKKINDVNRAVDTLNKDFNNRNKELKEKEEQLKDREKEQSRYDKYFDLRDQFIKQIDIKEYDYMKAVKAYERNGYPIFEYFDSHGQHQECMLIPELRNPARSDEERNQLNREYDNFKNDREVHSIKDRERLETRNEPNKDYEREAPSR